MSRVTRADFEKFKVHCSVWRTKLGLHNWALFFELADTDNSYATTHWRTSDHAATIQLCKKWDDMRPLNNMELERVAIHELCHIVLAPLVSEAEYRYSTSEAIQSTEHSIVRLLEEVLLGESNA